MKTTDKELLLKDLCARLPYKVIVKSVGENKILGLCDLKDIDNLPLPYLRPMSSMTEEEKSEIKALGAEFSPFGSIRFRIEEKENDGFEYGYKWLDILDFLNEHHFDYNELIPMGLALEASEKTYKV